MTESNNDQKPANKWVSYRPEIKVIDCTIRDGGLMNDHNFDDKFVRAVYNACVEGGIDYMEIGYKNSRRLFDTKTNGPWKFSSEEDIRRIVGDNDTDLKISVMADAEKSDYETDIVPRDQSPVDMIRVASYVHQVPLAMEMIQDAHDKGYETCVNLMAVSTVPEWELDEALAVLATSEALAIYVVDSFGALYSEQTHYLVDKYMGFAAPSGKTVGMHAHNNQQLGFSNTIEAIVKGANMVDASMSGLGRGAGNCPMESLIGFLHNPKFHLRPILQCIQETIEPMRQDVNWGFSVPYMITGLLNQHPRTAIEYQAGENGDDIVGFYDQMMDR
jgi:4-hydroxy 2-oxovalerate aldolase